MVVHQRQVQKALPVLSGLQDLQVNLVELDLQVQMAHLVILGEMVNQVLRESVMMEPQDTQAHLVMQVPRVLPALKVQKVISVAKVLKD
jgi:hypothetical protein